MLGISPKTGGRGAGLLSRLALGLLAVNVAAHAAEHVTLTNGFDLMCDHRSALGDHVRLYMDADGANFVDVKAAEIAATEHVDLPVTPAKSKNAASVPADGKLTDAELHELLTKAGTAHDLDVDLLASVVRQESGGNAR